ncbi:MAG: hypothetical protein WC813_02835 [Patescibacteria group bacterium]|jgi:hypothetical protein
MTWEMPDKHWVKLLSPTVFFGLIAFVLLFKFFTGGEPTSASYRSSCEEQGGEWLWNAQKPTCVFPGGKLVVFETQDTRPPTPSPVPLVTPSDYSTAPATDPAPECGYGVQGEFADYPATEFYKGRPHRPDFSTWPDAARYRTAITKDVARGVNFAGAYVVSRWGMPSDDAQKHEGFAIVDARTGRIVTYWTDTPTGIDFKLSSRFFRISLSTGPFAEIISNGNEVQCGRY